MEYIECVLGFNAVIHLLLVYVTGIILNIRIRKKQLFLSIILDASYMLIYIYKPLWYEGFKYMFGIILMMVTFYNLGKRNVIKASLIYYLENFLLGGIANILYMSNRINILSIIGVTILVLVITYIYKEKTRIRFDIKKLNYEILIIDRGKKYFISGYCDTGNFLLSDDMVNVVFINMKYKFGKYKKSISSQSIGVKNTLDLYTVDGFYIFTDKGYEKKEVYIAFSRLHYDGMFGLNLLGG